MCRGWQPVLQQRRGGELEDWAAFGIIQTLIAARSVRAAGLTLSRDAVDFKGDGSPATDLERTVESRLRDALAEFDPNTVFVGEETGGGYDGNTSGVSRTYLLPKTQVRVSIPCWMYTTANLGHDFFGRGAPVDHEVEPSIQDLLQGRDTELEFTRALILAR